MSSPFFSKVRQSIIENKEPVFVNFPNGNKVIYDLPCGSKTAPFCNVCQNSLNISTCVESYNTFGDKTSGTCDKCNLKFIIRYIY